MNLKIERYLPVRNDDYCDNTHNHKRQVRATSRFEFSYQSVDPRQSKLVTYTNECRHCNECHSNPNNFSF